ncbi:MAG TPA: pitrilysin family protein, partial [Longimicrobiaceae bacterium]|nr:pitrilysin family protein [Longimicrobiaceae bacterium]
VAPAVAQQVPRPEGYPATAPVPGPVPTLTVPKPVRRVLPNGLTVLYAPQRELPMVAAVLVTRGGTGDEPAELPGLAAFTAAMLDEGAAGKSALEIAGELESLGASLNTTAGWDAAQTSLLVLRKNLPGALRVMADVVTRPGFPEAEVQRIRQERTINLRRAADAPSAIAANAFTALSYPGGHPYGRFATVEGTERTDRESMSAFHERFYAPEGATLILTGDVDPDAVQPLVEAAFGGWRSGEPQPTYEVAAAQPARARTIYLVDKPGAPQSEVRIGHPVAPRDTPDYFPLTVLNTLLGGPFVGSRLNANLREKHGYTYAAGSLLSLRRSAGPIMAVAAVATPKTDSSVIEFMRELERLREEPVPEDELHGAKQFLALGLPARLETPPDVAARLAELVVAGVPTDFYDTYVQRVMAVTPDDVLRVARQYLHPDRAVVVVVGDRAAVEPGLRALGFGAVETRSASDYTR